MTTEDVKPDNPRVIDVDAEEAAAAEEEHSGETSPAGGRSKQGRLEKKSRKALSRLGLKPVPGVVKITIQKSKHLLLSIINPEVFKSPTSETYVVFGDAKIDDGHAKAANAFNPADLLSAAGVPNLSKVTEEAPEDAGEDVDLTGIDEKDVELVMTQGNCSRMKAITALKENNNDVVEAIMAVSTS